MKLTEGFNLLASAPDGIKRLRELILSLAVQGKLVPQDANDEPASELLKQIRAEKDRLIAEGKIKKDKPLPEISDDEAPYFLPQGWEWSMIAEVGITGPRNAFEDDIKVSFVQMSSIPAALFHPHLTETRAWKDVKTGFTHFAEGDVGVAKITPCFENGKSVVFRNLKNGFGAGTTELHVVRPLAGVNPNYVLLYLKNPMFLKEGEVGMTGSAGQKRLSRQFFEYNPFPLPPLAEQSRIVAKVEELMTLCDALEMRGKLEDQQHARLTATLFDALAASESAHQLQENWTRLAQSFDLILDRPAAVDALEQTLLQLAVRGLLVEQDPNDEPASELLKQIRAEKDRLIAEGKIKKDKPLPAITDEEKPFELPQGWEWARMQDAFDVRDGTHDSPKYVDVGIPLITSRNFNNGRIDFLDAKLISPSDHFEISKRSKVDVKDILYSMIGGNIGNQVIVLEDKEFSVKNVALFKYYDLAKSCPEYLDLYLKTITAKVKADAVGGAQPFVALGFLRNALLALPPLTEQSRIVARIEALRTLCAQLRERLTASQKIQTHLAETLVEQI